jgi:RNA polymerase sigma-54 factor
MLKQTQQLKLSHKLSPKQIQLMKLLQVPTANLEERIKDELESNPALDINVDYNANNNAEFKNEEKDTDQYDDNDKYGDDEYSYDDNIDLSSYLKSEYENDGNYFNNNDDDEQDRTLPIQLHTTLHDHLLTQLGLIKLNETSLIIAEQIIGSIDDDGYLRRDIYAITDDLAFKQNVYTTDEEVIRVLKIIQDFDPAGVGAKDLQECLLIQLHKSTPTEGIKIAIEILTNHFEEFSRRHYDKIKSKLRINDDILKEAISAITKLTPKPGLAFDSNSNQVNYVIPDFFITNNNGILELSLNSKNAPELKISENFREMFEAYNRNKAKTKRDKETIQFIKHKLDAAKWFIDSIKQRQHTLLITMNAIMEYQYNFFLSGDESALKPMILKDIADISQMDISTVSRVANSKYVQTEYGTYSLKHFFSEGTVTESGEEISTREVKAILQQLIEEEDKTKPISDEALTSILKEKGFNVARRTIAKYREQLNIPVARLRKQI